MKQIILILLWGFLFTAEKDFITICESPQLNNSRKTGCCKILKTYDLNKNYLIEESIFECPEDSYGFLKERKSFFKA